jgi:hypothetical protein
MARSSAPATPGRGQRRRGPVGVGAQGRARERRAQPRQVARRDGLPRPAARQRQHLGLLARGPRADGARGLRHRPLHRRRPGRRPARRRGPGHARRRVAARPRPVPPLGHRRARRAELALRCEAAAFATDRRITNSEGAGCRPSSRTSGPATRAAFAAAMPARATRCRCRRSPARARATCSATPGTARCATRRTGLARGGGPLRRRARAVAPEVAQDAHLRGAGAVRVDAGRRADRRLVQAVSAAARCTARPASCSTAWASRCWPTTSTSTKTRTCRAARAAPLRRRGRAHRARRWSTAAWCRATSCRATRRASWACAPPATPAARRTWLTSRLTRRATISTPCCASCDRGLFVTELMGQGVNGVTGDYSRGAAGFWVEGGRIVHPVHEVTIAGNLRTCCGASWPSAPTSTPRAARQRGLGADRSHEGGRRLSRRRAGLPSAGGNPGPAPAGGTSPRIPGVAPAVPFATLSGDHDHGTSFLRSQCRHRRRAGRRHARRRCTPRPPSAGAWPRASRSRWTRSTARPRCSPRRSAR